MTHWKQLANYDYLGAYSLENGKDKTVTIKKNRARACYWQWGTKRKLHRRVFFGRREADDSEQDELQDDTENLRHSAH